MKKTYLFLCLTFVLGISVRTLAQGTPPDAGTLKHQWTFDDGTAKDGVGTLNGTLMDGATISNYALNTTNGGWVNFDASALAINTYTSITTEVWFTAAKGNGDYTMLTCYGNTASGGGGENYLCTNPTHNGAGGSRTSITTNNPDNWSGDESGVNGPRCDDGVLHQLVSIVDGPNMTISLYIDGLSQGTTPLTHNNMISGLGTQYFYLAKSDWNADPKWKGLMEKVSIYDAALSADQVMYLFNQGAETQKTISCGAPSLLFDTENAAITTTITGENLSVNAPILMTLPAGITAQYNNQFVTSLPYNSLNAYVTFIYDGKTPVSGNILLKSGTTTDEIPVKATSSATCFVPLYSADQVLNLVPDPGLNAFTPGVDPKLPITKANGGVVKFANLFNDPTHVYCGASTLQLGDSTTAGGTFEFHPGVIGDVNNGSLAPSTTYRVKFMVKTTGGPFELSIQRTDLDNTANNNIVKPFDTGGVWKEENFYFITGARLDADPVISLTNNGQTGKLAYFDNFEIYPTSDPVIITDATSFAFDEQYLTSTFTVTSANLAGDVVVTTPAGITVDQPTVAANTASTVSVSWNGTTAVTGNITLTSGGAATITIPVKTLSTSNATCFTPLYTDRLNLIPDPYFNDKNQFNGWAHGSGTWGLISIVDEPDSVYCGSHSAKLFISADIEVPLGGMLTPNSGYIARAMVRTFGGAFHMGVNGEDTAIPGDLKDSIDTNGEWQQMTFKFNTGDAMAVTPVIFFNNDGNSGKLAYLDNWELYQEDQLNALVPVKDQFTKLYVQNGKIVAEFDLDHNSQVQLAVYTVQGSMVSFDKIAGITGKNTKVVSAVLPAGVYMVKLIKDGQTSFRKLIL